MCARVHARAHEITDAIEVGKRTKRLNRRETRESSWQKMHAKFITDVMCMCCVYKRHTTNLSQIKAISIAINFKFIAPLTRAIVRTDYYRRHNILRSVYSMRERKWHFYGTKFIANDRMGLTDFIFRWRFINQLLSPFATVPDTLFFFGWAMGACVIALIESIGPV